MKERELALALSGVQAIGQEPVLGGGRNTRAVEQGKLLSKRRTKGVGPATSEEWNLHPEKQKLQFGEVFHMVEAGDNEGGRARWRLAWEDLQGCKEAGF